MLCNWFSGYKIGKFITFITLISDMLALFGFLSRKVWTLHCWSVTSSYKSNLCIITYQYMFVEKCGVFPSADKCHTHAGHNIISCTPTDFFWVTDVDMSKKSWKSYVVDLPCFKPSAMFSDMWNSTGPILFGLFPIHTLLPYRCIVKYCHFRCGTK